MIHFLKLMLKNIANKSMAGLRFAYNLIRWRKVKLISFEISPQPHIHHGIVLLTWQVENASSVLLSGFGDVTGRSFIALRLPEGNHIFELKITGFGGVIKQNKPLKISKFEIQKPNKIAIDDFNFNANIKSIQVRNPSNIQLKLQIPNLNIELPNPKHPEVFINPIELFTNHKKLEIKTQNIEMDELELAKIKQINSISALEKLINA
jgi:hypothetical protein